MQCEKEDKGFWQDLFQNSLGLDGHCFQINKVIRLGKSSSEDKPRPVLVTLAGDCENGTL